MVRTKWYGQNGMDKMVCGQNGMRTKWYWKKWYGQNGMDKMVWTKWYADKMVLDKMVWTKWYADKMVRTKWYGQNGIILYFVYILIQLIQYKFSSQKSQINDYHIEES